MKVKETYICEVCGREYASEEECAGCERCHIPFKTTKSIYQLPWWFKKDKKYPIAINCVTENGNEYLYELTRIDGVKIL